MPNHTAVRITEKVWWVGAIDWELRDFHGYSTKRGTTYNAYLVMGSEPVLIDTVKAPFAGEMLERIASVTEPAKIRTVISNHAEMDHSGSLPEVALHIKPDRIICSAMGEAALKAHFHADWKLQPVKDGSEMEIGGERFQFLEARMLHWPDSMVSFLPSDGVLFSNDIFGMHLAHSHRFDDETVGWYYEAAKYYANIILPFSGIVTAFLEKFKAKNLPVKIIAPDHGPVWRKDIEKIIALYAKWAAQQPTDTAIVLFDTMWKSTEKLAGAAAEGLVSGGAKVKVMPLRAHHRSDVAVELLEAGALLVGGPTMNKQPFPTLADALTYLKGLNHKNLTGGAFGSYGWSPDGPRWIEAQLREMGVKLAGETVTCRYVPDAAALDAAFRLGEAVAKNLKRQP